MFTLLLVGFACAVLLLVLLPVALQPQRLAPEPAGPPEWAVRTREPVSQQAMTQALRAA